MLRLYSTYYLVIIIVFCWENFLIGNFEARRAQRYGKIHLSKFKRNLLFPGLYIKRFTVSSVIYQCFNLFLLILMIILGIVANLNTLLCIFHRYIFFQIFYFWLGPLAITGITSFKDTRRSFKNLKNRKNGTDSILCLLNSFDDRTCEAENAGAVYVKPISSIKGYVILISGRVDDTIPDIDYREVLENLLSLGYLLIYLQPDLFDDDKIYILNLENILDSIGKSINSSHLPLYLIGREGPDMLTMLLLLYEWEYVCGTIWVCESKLKKIKKGLQKDLNEDFKRMLEARKKDVCVVGINERFSIEKLDIWLKEKGIRLLED